MASVPFKPKYVFDPPSANDTVRVEVLPERMQESDKDPGGRVRLADLDTHLHCSIIGTCLTDTELRKTIGHFIDVTKASELDVHHEAVRLANTDVQAARALHKTLDRRYEPVVRRFRQAKDESGVEVLWQEFLRRGEVPGAYWAVMTHRQTTSSLRQRVFGEVHMLSHLMGASTRADIRQRVALEAENADLKAQLAQLQSRHQRLTETHDRSEQERQQMAAQLAAANTRHAAALPAVECPSAHDISGRQADSVARQTALRERAEAQVQLLVGQGDLLSRQVDSMRNDLQEMSRELHSAETQLQRLLQGDENESAEPSDLREKRVAYVGGRPSSIIAIREFVERCGGELRRHDGGLEDRKGQLAGLIGWADLVAFPVDCIDHDSATNLKRQCLRLGVPFAALRSASVASFVAAVTPQRDTTRSSSPASHFCLRHG